jgi:hypothetical protein
MMQESTSVQPVSAPSPSVVPPLHTHAKPHAVEPSTPVVPPPPQEIDPMVSALAIFKKQHRECWICAKVATLIETGKTPSDDDAWHFCTCVTSWGEIQR